MTNFTCGKFRCRVDHQQPPWYQYQHWRGRRFPLERRDHLGNKSSNQHRCVAVRNKISIKIISGTASANCLAQLRGARTKAPGYAFRTGIWPTCKFSGLGAIRKEPMFLELSDTKMIQLRHQKGIEIWRKYWRPPLGEYFYE